MLRKITKIIKNKETKNILIEFINEITELELVNILFNKVEKFQSIAEYDFFLINLIGIAKDGKKEELFLKIIKKGKIKESLFCICDLAYEKYFKNIDSLEKEIKSPKKIAILEEKENVKQVNKVLVNLFENDLNQKKVNIEINFIEISKIIEQNRVKKINKKGWEECIEINPKDIIIVGVKNRY